MSSEARTVSVHILGQEYRVRSTEDGEFVREVASYVDELMHRISTSMTASTKTRIAVLAALNIAEELFRERRDGLGGGSEEVDNRVRAVVARVDQIVAEAERIPGTRPRSRSRSTVSTS